MGKKKAPARRAARRAPARKAPARKAPARKAPARRAPARRSSARRAKPVVRVVRSGRKLSRFKRIDGGLSKRVKNRFQKFYYLHRPALNRFRRSTYADKKKNGICVKCKKKALASSIFCSYHLRKSRVYNSRR